MTGRAAVLATIAIALGMALVAGRHHAAVACSRASISAGSLPWAAEHSEIVAIGTFTEVTHRSASFRVDESMVGSTKGSTLQVDNRTSYTYMACSPYDEPFHHGGRFKAGDKRILMLEKQVDGLWQIAFFGDAAWSIPADDLQPLITDLWNDGTRPPSLDAVRATVKPTRAGSEATSDGNLGHRAMR